MESSVKTFKKENTAPHYPKNNKKGRLYSSDIRLEYSKKSPENPKKHSYEEKINRPLAKLNNFVLVDFDISLIVNVKKDFKTNKRKKFIQTIATENQDELRAKGFSDKEIKSMKNEGVTPNDWSVHHKFPRSFAESQGFEYNYFENLILLRENGNGDDKEHRLFHEYMDNQIKEYISDINKKESLSLTTTTSLAKYLTRNDKTLKITIPWPVGVVYLNSKEKEELTKIKNNENLNLDSDEKIIEQSEKELSVLSKNYNERKENENISPNLKNARIFKEAEDDIQKNSPSLLNIENYVLTDFDINLIYNIKKDFKTNKRKKFIQTIATENKDELRAKGFSDKEIKTMKDEGITPNGYAVHHKFPRFFAEKQGIEYNHFENLILLKEGAKDDDGEHKFFHLYMDRQIRKIIKNIKENENKEITNETKLAKYLTRNNKTFKITIPWPVGAVYLNPNQQKELVKIKAAKNEQIDFSNAELQKKAKEELEKISKWYKNNTKNSTLVRIYEQKLLVSNKR